MSDAANAMLNKLSKVRRGCRHKFRHASATSIGGQSLGFCRLDSVNR